MFVDILGVKYIVIRKIEDEEIKSAKNIFLLQKQTIRHEVIHAFTYESGLWSESGETKNWSLNEEMVDWIAIQFPKMVKVFKKLDVDKE